MALSIRQRFPEPMYMDVKTFEAIATALGFERGVTE